MYFELPQLSESDDEYRNRLRRAMRAQTLIQREVADEAPPGWTLPASSRFGSQKTTDLGDLVPGLLPRRSLVYFSGPPQIGKSRVMFTLMHSLAHGKPFLGVACPRLDRGVHYVDIDMTPEMSSEWGEDVELADVPHFGYTNFRSNPEDFDLRNRGILTAWADKLRDENVGILVIDSFTKLLIGLGIDPKHNLAPGQAMLGVQRLMDMADLDAAIVIGHPPRSGEVRMFGGIAQEVIVDVEWHMTGTRGNGPRTLAASGRDVTWDSLSVTYQESRGMYAEASAQQLLEGRQAAVVNFMRSHPERLNSRDGKFTAEELYKAAQAVGSAGRKSAFTSWLPQQARKGFLRAIPAGKRTYYTLGDVGKEYVTDETPPKPRRKRR